MKTGSNDKLINTLTLLDKLYSSRVVDIAMCAQQAIMSKETQSDGLPSLLRLLAQKVRASNDKVDLSDAEQGLLDSWLSYDPLVWYVVSIDYRALALEVDFTLSLEQPARNSLEAAYIALGKLLGFMGDVEIGGTFVSVVKKLGKEQNDD